MKFDNTSALEIDCAINLEELLKKEITESNERSISLLKFFNKVYLKYTFAREGDENIIRKYLENIIKWLEDDINEYNNRQDKDNRGAIKWR